MNELKYPETTKYAVAHNGEDVFHYAVVEPNLSFSSGQPFMEIFDSEEEAKKKFPESTFNPSFTLK